MQKVISFLAISAIASLGRFFHQTLIHVLIGDFEACLNAMERVGGHHANAVFVLEDLAEAAMPDLSNITELGTQTSGEFEESWTLIMDRDGAAIVRCQMKRLTGEDGIITGFMSTAAFYSSNAPRAVKERVLALHCSHRLLSPTTTFVDLK